MQNYKALKSASKVSVRKVDVDGKEELQTVSKSYDPTTGSANDDTVREIDITSVAMSIARIKEEILKLQADQADLEQLETDLKAL